MARKPSDDARDDARDLKIKNQVNPRVVAPGTKGAFDVKTAHPKRPTRQSLKIDHKESHHLLPVHSYNEFVEGMTEQQIKQVDARLEQDKFYKGNNNLNRIDIWKRYHQGRAKGVYAGQGAHQRANEAGFDGPKAKAKWGPMSPIEKLAELETFVKDMKGNRRIAYEADMAGRQLLGANNTSDNKYGGNFTQRILNPRDEGLASKNKENTVKQREHLSNQSPLAITTKAQAPTTTAKQGTPPKPTQTTAPQTKTKPQELGGYQGMAPAPWSTPGMTTGQAPTDTNWTNNALTIAGSVAAVGGQLLKSLLIASPLLR